jgi:hypothetical protein
MGEMDVDISAASMDETDGKGDRKIKNSHLDASIRDYEVGIRCVPMLSSMDERTTSGALVILGMPFLREYAVYFDRSDWGMSVAQIHGEHVCSKCGSGLDASMAALGGLDASVVALDGHMDGRDGRQMTRDDTPRDTPGRRVAALATLAALEQDESGDGDDDNSLDAVLASEREAGRRAFARLSALDADGEDAPHGRFAGEDPGSRKSDHDGRQMERDGRRDNRNDRKDTREGRKTGRDTNPEAVARDSRKTDRDDRKTTRDGRKTDHDSNRNSPGMLQALLPEAEVKVELPSVMLMLDDVNDTRASPMKVSLLRGPSFFGVPTMMLDENGDPITASTFTPGKDGKERLVAKPVRGNHNTKQMRVWVL